MLCWTHARLLAACLIALPMAAHAQDLPRFPTEDFGKAVLSRDQAITGGVSYEAFIGGRNIEFLEGYGPNTIFRQVGRAVGRLDVLTDTGTFPCTAFLIAGNRLVTNHHCVPGITEDPRTGATSIFAVEFRAGFLRDGLEGEDTVFRVSPAPLESDKALDYSVLQILGDANAAFGALDLSDALPEDRDPFWVIGHPDGRALQISREKCQAAAPAINAGRVRHTCDTLPGSSGSPVIDAGLRQVVALHHAAAGGVNLAVPMRDILAQSQVLVASAGTSSGGDGAAAAELAALRAELAEARAQAQEEARALAEAERARLEAEMAALKAAQTAEPVVAGLATEVPNSAQFSPAYWKKQPLRLTGHEDVVYSAGFSPDGGRIVTASKDGTARIWDTQSGALVAVLSGHEGWVYGASFSPDGGRIVTASLDGTARIWDAQSGALVAVLSGHKGYVASASFSPDGGRIVTTSSDETARIWDAQSGALVAVLSGHEDWVNRASFSPDGGRIVTASLDGTARIWDAQSGALVAVLSGHKGVVYSAGFSPDGGRIVTTSSDKTARIWDAQSGALVAVLSGHTGRVVSASFSPDGGRIVTASRDKTARIWAAQSGALVAVLSGHESWVYTASFSPDRQRIVTASGDKTARIWDAQSGALVAVLSGHESLVMSAGFSPDGTRIVTASVDDTARVWGGQ